MHPSGDKDVDSIVIVVTLMDCSEIKVLSGVHEIDTVDGERANGERLRQ